MAKSATKAAKASQGAKMAPKKLASGTSPEALEADQAKRLAPQLARLRRAGDQFLASQEVGNIGGMEAALAELRAAELQAAFVFAAGSVQVRNERLARCDELLAAAKAARMSVKKTDDGARRWARQDKDKEYRLAHRGKSGSTPQRGVSQKKGKGSKK